MSTYDPFDLKGIEENKVKDALQSRLDKEAEEADFKWLMSSKRGRRIVWRLMDFAGVFRSSFSPTAMVMAFQEGNRNYGNRILAKIHKICPELYPIMMKENTNDRGEQHQSGS